MEGVCLAMGQCLPEPQLLQGLGAVLQPVLGPLAQRLQVRPMRLVPAAAGGLPGRLAGHSAGAGGGDLPGAMQGGR
jgi:hypothetical protein